MSGLSVVQKIAIWVLPVLFAITVHEVSHGWVARRFGDRTADLMGRLTLNPLKHIDPIGTLLVPALTLFFGGFAIGWAKPVPVDWRNFANPVRDMAYVALAGPVANLAMGLLWALVARLAIAFHGTFGASIEPLILMGVAGTVINAVLMVLNLLPIPPLDGSRVLSALLPARLRYRYNQLEPWGLYIVIGLLLLGWLGTLMNPVLLPTLSMFARTAGIPWGVFNSIVFGIS